MRSATRSTVLTDSHAHLSAPPLFDDVAAILERAWRSHVRRIINISVDIESLDRGLALSKTHPWVFNAGATHPHDTATKGEAEFEAFRKRAPELKAIGETGLDYHYDHSPRETQKIFLARFLELAQESHLPVIIHCREAFSDFFDIFDRYAPLPGVLHCFTGTQEEARKVLDRGLFLSLSGIVTYKKSLELQEIAQWLPLDRLLIETDAPFLAPRTERGKQNEPSFLVETAQFIATLRHLPYDELAAATSANAAKLFQLT